jgi:Leucine-rich repeat (LRR) protein
VTTKGNKVTRLNFSDNNLTGTLPAEIGNLTGLEYLSFYYGNSLSGNLPETVGNLTELRLLSFEDNNFTGEIPTSYANLKKLSGLWLWNNKLSGNIPEFIRTFNNLVFLDLSENQFSGTIPDFTTLPNLNYLAIGMNYFNANDFIAQFEAYQNLQYSWNNNYYYSPQFTFDEPEEIGIALGSDVTLTLTDVPSTSRSINNKSKFTANTYQWYKDNIAISGANNNSYTINNV